jgi:hypothetical protein
VPDQDAWNQFSCLSVAAIENSMRCPWATELKKRARAPRSTRPALVQLTNKLCSRVAAKLYVADRGNQSQIFWGRQNMRGAFMNLRRNQTSR